VRTAVGGRAHRTGAVWYHKRRFSQRVGPPESTLPTDAL